MRIAYWLSALLVTGACSGESKPAASRAEPATVSAFAANDRTRLEIRAGPNTYTVDVSVDSSVRPGTVPTAVEIVGEIPARAIVLIDRYPSMPGGLSFCQAGEESFLRIISLSGANPKESFVTKIASCSQNLELSDAGVQWQRDTATVLIDWLSGPSGSPEARKIEIAPDGSPLPARPAAN